MESYLAALLYLGWTPCSVDSRSDSLKPEQYDSSLSELLELIKPKFQNQDCTCQFGVPGQNNIQSIERNFPGGESGGLVTFRRPNK